nr:forkhead box protein o4 [Quercus suber]
MITMHDSGDLQEPHVYEDDLQMRGWHHAPAMSDQSHTFIGTDSKPSINQSVLGDCFSPRQYWPATDLEAVTVNTYRQSIQISFNEDIIGGSAHLLEPQSARQPQYSDWRSLNQETVTSSDLEDIDFWNMQPQGQDASGPNQLHNEFVPTVLPPAQASDDVTYNGFQDACNHADTADQTRTRVDGCAIRQGNRSGNVDGIDGTTADLEGDEQCYAKLLFRALIEAPGNSLDLKSLYKWIELNSNKSKGPDNHGWRNSVRHNLSMNGAFVRIGYTPYSRHTAKTCWKLTDEAIREGIQSTTRYRKTPKQNKTRKGVPAIKRQQSGAKGGQATKRATRARLARQRLEDEQRLREQQQPWQPYQQQSGRSPSIIQSHGPVQPYSSQGADFHAATPQQQPDTFPSNFGMTSSPIQLQQTPPYMPLFDSPDQVHVSPALGLPNLSQSPQVETSFTALRPGAPTEKPLNGNDYSFEDPYMNETLFGEDSGFCELDTTPRDDGFGYTNDHDCRNIL